MKQCKRALSLIEVMIVIFIIGIVSSVIGYNMRGSLDKGRAFKTQQAINKIYEIVEFETAQRGDPDLLGELSGEGSGEGHVVGVGVVEGILKGSHLVRRPALLLKDGWGDPFVFFRGPHDRLKVISSRYQAYCVDNDVEPEYPWED